MNDMRSVAAAYLQVRRSLGFKMRDEKLIFQFIDFLKREKAEYITYALALRWATMPACHPARWKNRYGAIRRFAQYVQSLEPKTEVLPKGALQQRYPRRKPYIYTDREILRLAKAAKQSRAPKGLWGWTFYTLFSLLAVTGMRVAELVNLNREDVDLKDGILIIRESKFRKSRLIPIHTSTSRALARYARLRDTLFSDLHSGSFFVTERGKRLTPKRVEAKFLALARKIGLRGPEGIPGPRLHDLRHTFTVRTLLNWYRSGADVEAHLPELSTYLGHRGIDETFWYISAVPELLDLAVQRLEHL